MTSRPDPTETLLDLLVYAPLGLALEVRDRAASLAQKGRERLAGQQPAARLIGQVVVGQGRKRAEQALKLLRQPPVGSRAGADRQRPEDGPSRAPETPDPPTPPSAASPLYPPPPPPPAPDERGEQPAAANAATVARALGVTADPSMLAIPGYDTLSASQVVPRLEGLSADDLEAVRAYEQATRARKTILIRISQLRGA